MPKRSPTFKNRLHAELQQAERTPAWLHRKLVENGNQLSVMTVRKWVRNQAQPRLGQAAEIAQILQIPIRRLLSNQKESEERLFGQDFLNKLDSKFKKA